MTGRMDERAQGERSAPSVAVTVGLARCFAG